MLIKNNFTRKNANFTKTKLETQLDYANYNSMPVDVYFFYNDAKF